MFTKTDMAKFENTWDDKPTWVNKGAQKNFFQYAKRIGEEYEKNPDQFNEFYYQRVIARAIVFKRAEKIVSDQTWYGGYRANIVPYTLALLGKLCTMEGKSIDFKKIWDRQDISDGFRTAIEITSGIVQGDITNPPQSVSNISEWCKTDSCWTRLQEHIPQLKNDLPESFFNELVSREDVKEERRAEVIETIAAIREYKKTAPKEAQLEILLLLEKLSGLFKGKTVKKETVKGKTVKKPKEKDDGMERE